MEHRSRTVRLLVEPLAVGRYLLAVLDRRADVQLVGLLELREVELETVELVRDRPEVADVLVTGRVERVVLIDQAGLVLVAQRARLVLERSLDLVHATLDLGLLRAESRRLLLQGVAPLAQLRDLLPVALVLPDERLVDALQELLALRAVLRRLAATTRLRRSNRGRDSSKGDHGGGRDNYRSKFHNSVVGTGCAPADERGWMYYDRRSRRTISARATEQLGRAYGRSRMRPDEEDPPSGMPARRSANPANGERGHLQPPDGPDGRARQPGARPLPLRLRPSLHRPGPAGDARAAVMAP